MPAIYANLIIAEEKTFAQVPDEIKPQVKQSLIDKGHGELAEV